MKEKITPDLFERLEKLYTGLICDVLQEGLRKGATITEMFEKYRVL